MAKKQSNTPEAASGSTSSGLGEKIANFKEYLEESKGELRKVSWPTRKEAWATSITVLVFVFVMSLFLGLLDLGLTRTIEFILS